MRGAKLNAAHDGRGSIVYLFIAGFARRSGGGNVPITSRYVFIASMDVAPEKEALFNEVYDREHVPNLLKVPGVRSVTRLRTEPASMKIGGESKPLSGEGAPRYTAIYE